MSLLVPPVARCRLDGDALFVRLWAGAPVSEFDSKLSRLSGPEASSVENATGLAYGQGRAGLVPYVREGLGRKQSQDPGSRMMELKKTAHTSPRSRVC